MDQAVDTTEVGIMAAIGAEDGFFSPALAATGALAARETIGMAGISVDLAAVGLTGAVPEVIGKKEGDYNLFLRALASICQFLLILLQIC